VGRNPHTIFKAKGVLMEIIKMNVKTSHCIVEVIDGKVQTLLDVREHADVPCVYIHKKPKILGNREVNKIEYIIPKRLECNQPLMIEHN